MVVAVITVAAAAGFIASSTGHEEPARDGPAAAEVMDAQPIGALTAEDEPGAPPPEPRAEGSAPEDGAPEPSSSAEADSPSSSDGGGGSEPASSPSTDPDAPSSSQREPEPDASSEEPNGNGPSSEPPDGEEPESEESEPAEPVQSELYLTAPALTDPGTSEVFTATWVDTEGYGIDGVVELQRAEGDVWTTIASLETEVGEARTEVTVASSAIYRLAYGGGEGMAPEVSAEVAVIAEERLESAVAVSASPGKVVDGEAAALQVSWKNADGVPIIGDLELQRRKDGSWTRVKTVSTGADGAAKVKVTPSGSASYRLRYEGGTRYLLARSEPVKVTVVQADTIPVRECSSQAGVDTLPHGVGCHYTPVESGVFVVGHDYRGNAWWNSLEMESYVRLKGELAGLYEVVNRVIAPGRAQQLGSASNWACGDDCDVVLQTCTGDNTGFTWLRRLR